MAVRTRPKLRRSAVRGLALAMTAILLTSCGSWRGIANVAVPGGPGTGEHHLTLYVQMPDTLALNINSRVRVADVFVGTVRAIDIKNWVARLTLDVQPTVKLPVNAIARIGQTSLLGTQHVELDMPAHPTAQLLKNGDTIPLENAEAFPSIERVLAAFAVVLRGGGIPNLEVISNEVTNMLTGRADQIRQFLNRLDTFTADLNGQADDLTRAIDSSQRLLAIFAQHNTTLDSVLTEFPPLIKHFADTQDVFVNAVAALGRISAAADAAFAPSSSNLHTNLQLLQRPLCELGKASPYLVNALKLLVSAPFETQHVKKVIRGDYINVSLMLDLTLSDIDNGFLTGTGFSGALRALEQSWGRNPSEMSPDVRFTPNPHDVPGGPYVDRGDGIC